LPLLCLKLPTQAFVPSPNSHAKACPGQEMNSRKLNHVRVRGATTISCGRPCRDCF
jgi:hypothetical protein